MTKIAFFRAKIYFRYSRPLAHSLGRRRGAAERFSRRRAQFSDGVSGNLDRTLKPRPFPVVIRSRAYKPPIPGGMGAVCLLDSGCPSYSKVFIKETWMIHIGNLGHSAILFPASL